MTFGGPKNTSGGGQGASFGSVMARGGNINQPQGPLSMSLMAGNKNNGQTGSSSRTQIGLKSGHGISQPQFKAGGPIRATATLENMDRSHLQLKPQGSSGAGQTRFGLPHGNADGDRNQHHSATLTGGSHNSLASSKMPQRPGSSKPVQKGNLLDMDDQGLGGNTISSQGGTTQPTSKRPESPSNVGKKTTGKCK